MHHRGGGVEARDVGLHMRILHGETPESIVRSLS
jgi:hypothetical protein